MTTTLYETTSSSLLAPHVFFDLVDEVLVDAGREPLDGGDPHRRIITVRPEDRVLQILAGAGSGKTEMLVWRVLYELMVLGTSASRVIVTTFTRKAATELAVRMVERSDALGLPADAKEAMAFAVLGYETLRGRAANVPAATGARRGVVLGALAPHDLRALFERLRLEIGAEEIGADHGRA